MFLRHALLEEEGEALGSWMDGKEENLAPLDFEWGIGRIFMKLEKLDGYWK